MVALVVLLLIQLACGGTPAAAPSAVRQEQPVVQAPVAEQPVQPQSAPAASTPVVEVQRPAEDVEVRWYRQPAEFGPQQALYLIPVVGAVAAADNATIVGIADDPVAVVIIAGLCAYVVVSYAPQAVEAVVEGAQGLYNWAAEAVAQQMALEAFVGTMLAGSALGDNWWLSMRHGTWIPELGVGSESKTVAELFYDAYPGNNGDKKGQNKGQGHSNGSIQCKAGITTLERGTVANFACLHVVGRNANFVVVQARAAENMFGQAGWERIGQSTWYYFTKEIWWECAWILSERPINGHSTPPQHLWLNAHTGSAAYDQIVAKYNLVIPIAEFPIPRLPWR